MTPAFDPATTADVIDWTHANSVFVDKPGSYKFATLSLRNWNQVVRYNFDLGTIAWELNGGDPARSDLTLTAASTSLEPADFGGQHHVTYDNGQLMLFDNRQGISTSDTDARVITWRSRRDRRERRRSSRAS